MFIFWLILSLSLIGFGIHLFFEKRPYTRKRILELLLLYQLVFSVGMTSLLAFFALTLMPDFIASFTGWPSCPFEQQLANVNLAFATLGTLCIWFRNGFWTATVLGFSIWILGDGIANFAEMLFHHNYADGNIGTPLITDFLVPILLLILLWLYKRED